MVDTFPEGGTYLYVANAKHTTPTYTKICIVRERVLLYFYKYCLPTKKKKFECIHNITFFCCPIGLYLTGLFQERYFVPYGTQLEITLHGITL